MVDIVRMFVSCRGAITMLEQCSIKAGPGLVRASRRSIVRLRKLSVRCVVCGSNLVHDGHRYGGRYKERVISFVKTVLFVKPQKGGKNYSVRNHETVCGRNGNPYHQNDFHF